MIDEDGCEVEGRLSCLCFESVDDDRIVVFKEGIDLIHGTKHRVRDTST